MEGLEAIGHDFDAASIGQRIVHIHVRHCDIASNAGPASRQICATARSRVGARAAKTPVVAQAARWSPRASMTPPQVQRLEGEGEGNAQSAEQCDAELRAGHS